MINIQFHVDGHNISIDIGTLGKETVTYDGRVVSVIKSKITEAFKSDHTHTFAEMEGGRQVFYELRFTGNMNTISASLNRGGQRVAALENMKATQLMKVKSIIVTPQGIAPAPVVSEAADPAPSDAAAASGAEPDGKWWQTALWGLFLIAAAIGLFFYFEDFERSSDSSRRMNAIVALLYNIGGKWLASGVLGAIGGIMLILSAGEYNKQRR